MPHTHYFILSIFALNPWIAYACAPLGALNCVETKVDQPLLGTVTLDASGNVETVGSDGPCASPAGSAMLTSCLCAIATGALKYTTLSLACFLLTIWSAAITSTVQTQVRSVPCPLVRPWHPRAVSGTAMQKRR
jgi:hypothetical protein